MCETVSAVTLPYKVDFVECLEVDTENAPRIACAMYELFEACSEKRGGLCTLEYEANTGSLSRRAECYGDALYKLTWLDADSILAVSSCGDLCGFRWCKDSTIMRSFAATITNASLTSVSVSKKPQHVNPRILIGDAVGYLHYGQIGNGSFQSEFSWCGHSLAYHGQGSCEIMCTEVDTSNAFIVYSGGDDCQWKSWDLRLPVKKPLYENKFHSAGVTCLFDDVSGILVSSSYDDSISAWDKRNPSLPVDCVHLGGAAWTIRRDKTSVPRRFICACIHQGVVEIVTTDSWKMTLRCVDNRLGSQMVYSADWFSCERNMIVVSSYSDRKVHLLTLP